MKKALIYIFSIILVLVLTVVLAGEWWVENILTSMINNNPQRAYDITFQDLDLHLMLDGVTLQSAQITPINASDTVTVINGSVDRIELAGVKMLALLIGRRAIVNELILVTPDFEILVTKNTHTEKKDESTGGLQTLFGDILTRGVVHNFKVQNASVTARNKSDSLLIAKVDNYNLYATEIETDSIQAKSIIPFKVGSIHSSVDSGYFHVNDYTELKTGRMEYNALDSKLELNNISLNFTKDRMTVSNLVGAQVDLIQAKLNRLTISQLDAQTSWYQDLNIRAKTIEIEGLELKDFRDKNKSRPPDFEKPMFNGMVDSIPVPIRVDSIIIKDSNIFYSELAEKKEEAGTVSFNDVNGSITNVTNMPEFQQQHQSFTASIEAKLNRKADMLLNLDIPYDGSTFNLHATIGGFDLDILNPTIIPLAGIEAKSGTVHKIDVKMNASRTEASNVLTMNYEDLSLELMRDHNHVFHKKALVSFIANSAVRNHNMPDHGHYIVADYQSFRNIHRGPFNFMWVSVKEGMLYIVPTGASGLLLGDPEKKAEKALDKEEKKHQRKEKKKKKAST